MVSTMHKAKGLEWDRVYMLSVNNYDYPSNQPNDRFISEKWFVRDGLNLEAEALAPAGAPPVQDGDPALSRGRRQSPRPRRLRPRALAAALRRASRAPAES